MKPFCDAILHCCFQPSTPPTVIHRLLGWNHNKKRYTKDVSFFLNLPLTLNSCVDTNMAKLGLCMEDYMHMGNIWTGPWAILRIWAFALKYSTALVSILSWHWNIIRPNWCINIKDRTEPYGTQIHRPQSHITQTIQLVGGSRHN